MVSHTMATYCKYFLSCVFEAVTMALAIVVCNAFINAGPVSYTHLFTEEEKNFVVQFAFRSGSKEDTISLIEALAHSADKAESDEIMVTYRSKYDMKPAWVEQVENLLVALEMYRIEAVSYTHLAKSAPTSINRGF